MTWSPCRLLAGAIGSTAGKEIRRKQDLRHFGEYARFGRGMGRILIGSCADLYTVDSDRLRQTTQNKIEKQAVSLSKRQCPLCALDLHASATTCPKCDVPVGEQFAPGGKIADKYEILDTIGSGGMGIIYKAKLIFLDKVVAIKMLHSHLATSTALMRFQQEGKAASSLSHPNVISIHDLGVTAIGQPYMVMDYVEGETLQEKLKHTGALSREEFLQIFKQVLSAIQHAHSKNLLHRDIKPSNIMLMKDVEPDRNVKILDFGIAKMLDEQGEGIHLTKTGEALGSPLYMSPEQALGKKVDLRSDLYSLGCVMYECLTNAPPLMGENVVDTMMKHMNEMPLPLKDTFMAGDFHRETNDLVMKLLAKEPEARFQTAGDILAELKKIELHQGSRVETVGTLREKASLPWHKKEIAWDKVAIACLCSVVFGGVGAVAIYSLLQSEKSSSQTKVEFTEMTVAPERLDSESALIKEFIQRSLSRGDTDFSFRSVFGSMGAVDSDLQWFKDGRKVTRIDLSGNKITGAGLKHITHLPIKTLDLTNCENLKSIEPLKNMKTLVHLSLAKTPITDQGLSVINTLSNLEYIGLSGTNITDETIARLSRMPSLTNVDFQGCPHITAAKVNALEKANQRLKVTANCMLNSTRKTAEAEKLLGEGKYGQALAIYQEELSKLERVHGPSSLSLIPMLVAIANVQQQLNHVSEAEAAFLKAYNISLKPGGCVSKSDCMDYLAFFYIQHGQIQKAKEFALMAVQERKKRDPSDWKHICMENRMLGSIYTLEKNWPAAENVLREVNFLLKREGIQNDFEEVHAQAGLGELYRVQAVDAQSEPDRALALHSSADAALDKAIAILQKSRNSDTVDTPGLYALIARNAEPQEKWSRAEYYWRMAAESAAKHSTSLPALRKAHADYIHRLALVLRVQHKDAEAVRMEEKYKELEAALPKS